VSVIITHRAIKANALGVSELLNHCHKLISVAFAQTSINDAAFEVLQNEHVGQNILNLNLYSVNITDVT